MKRFIAVLSGILILPAYAQAVLVYDDAGSDSFAVGIVGENEPDVDDVDTAAFVVPVAQASSRNPRAGASSISRAVPAGAGTTPNTRSASTRATTTSRNVSGSTVARSAVANTIARSAERSAASSRVASRTVHSAVPVSTPKAAARRIATPVNPNINTARSVSARVPTISTTVGNVSSATDAASASATDVVAVMDELATLSASCKTQYTDCMDNFCNVLDDNQGRCSCSKNVKNYEKTENALKEATEALKDVAQQIQYIGLTSEEIEILFSQTEAELEMQQTSDSSRLKNDLDKIKKLLVDVKGSAATSSEVDMSFDLSGLLDFSVDSTGFDLTSLFGGSSSNTSSISNQRGEQLYKTAAARCKKAVLETCESRGVDISVISNAYDMEIDKQCVVYERQLTDTNDEMSQTVRNAKSVLQRARLMVAQNKNSYDLRGCVNALDSCMQDDFVCGSDYEYCLDPTGKYIVNGEVVVGSMPGYVISSSTVPSPSTDYSKDTLYGTWYYDNTYVWGTSGQISDYIDKNVSTSAVTKADANMAKNLQYKIGYNDGEKNYGMCMSVLNKCQDITYNNGKYQPDNQVIREYLRRTLIQIKAAQDSILHDYASGCISDVTSCLSSNNYDSTSNSKANIAINACRAEIVTCMSVNGDSTQPPEPTAMKNWVAAINSVSSGSDDPVSVGCSEYYYHNGSACVSCKGGTWDAEQNGCLCPTWTSGARTDYTTNYGCSCSGASEEQRKWCDTSPSGTHLFTANGSWSGESPVE